MTKSIGIIGNSGRMGRILVATIEQHARFKNSVGFSRSQKPYRSIHEVFERSDYVVDFSNPELFDDVVTAASHVPKPLVICTTGWLYEEKRLGIDDLAKKTPVVIASNTSVGAYLQRYLVSQLAKVLGPEYDIDIVEKHHRNKIDIPSGTAISLLQDIQRTKRDCQDLVYQTYPMAKGPRPEHVIGMHVERSGTIPGDHEVSFTSAQELISIKHRAFDRTLFATGALRIIEWLDVHTPDPGLYTMQDVLNLA